MNNSLTIVIPNRNRKLKTVKRSISSIVPQLTSDIQLIIVDYGSEESYQNELKNYIESISQVELILCPTQGQLWNKSRCINIVLKKCSTTHLMVSDMDVIWHPDFIENYLNSVSHNASVYFPVGVMTQKESAQEKHFENYNIKFQTTYEATGISIFLVQQLLTINGFDEFYHGWGSEDTDVHVRLKNAGYEVRFRESEIYFKHQWHQKNYRSITSYYPYHTNQERINACYLYQAKQLKKIEANIKFEMGLLPLQLDKSQLQTLKISSIENEVKGLLGQLCENRGNYQIQIDCASTFSFKRLFKKIIRDYVPHQLQLEQVNDIVLEWIINNARLSGYSFKIVGTIIFLNINLYE